MPTRLQSAVVELSHGESGREKTPPLRYVLSAGRTGTVFLENFLNTHLSDVTAVHEPRETRTQMMLANLRNDWGVGYDFLEKLFRTSRQKREAAVHGTYVELNPFLCAMTDLLPVPGRNLHVVHMVRDPASWAQSLVSFKASDKFRPLIDFVPFAKPYPSPRPDGWGKQSEYERALWRWRWCNERIEAIRSLCHSYTVIRYEDLFSEDPGEAQATIGVICATLGLQHLGQIDRDEMNRRVNAKPPSAVGVDKAAAKRICGDLAGGYGYAY